MKALFGNGCSPCARVAVEDTAGRGGCPSRGRGGRGRVGRRRSSSSAAGQLARDWTGCLSGYDLHVCADVSGGIAGRLAYCLGRYRWRQRAAPRLRCTPGWAPRPRPGAKVAGRNRPDRLDACRDCGRGELQRVPPLPDRPRNQGRPRRRHHLFGRWFPGGERNRGLRARHVCRSARRDRHPQQEAVAVGPGRSVELGTGAFAGREAGRLGSADGILVGAASGGPPHRLVAGGRCPQWSPDGRSIAYLSVDDSLQVIPASGGASQALFKLAGNCSVPGAPTWSPESKRIAFEPGDRLAIVNVSTHRAHLDSPKLGRISGGFAWSADGSHVYASVQPLPEVGCDALWLSALPRSAVSASSTPADSG